MGRVPGIALTTRFCRLRMLSELVAKMLDRFPPRNWEQQLSTPAVTRGPLIKTSCSSDKRVVGFLAGQNRRRERRGGMLIFQTGPLMEPFGLDVGEIAHLENVKLGFRDRRLSWMQGHV